MDFSGFSRAKFEEAARDEKNLAQFLSELEKAISQEWSRRAMEWAAEFMEGLNAQGHKLRRMEEFHFTFGDIRPEGEKSLTVDIFSTCGVSVKPGKPESREIPQEEKWYFEAVDRIFKKYLDSGYQALTADERILHSVDQLEREINNGGFSQYFYNSAGDNATDALASLKTIGAKKTAKLLESAMSLFPDGLVPTDREERILALEKLETIHPGKLNKLDSRFYKGADFLMQALCAHLMGKI